MGLSRRDPHGSVGDLYVRVRLFWIAPSLSVLTVKRDSTDSAHLGFVGQFDQPDVGFGGEVTREGYAASNSTITSLLIGRPALSADAARWWTGGA